MPDVPTPQQAAAIAARNSRVAILLVLLYAGFFGEFLYLQMFHPAAMASTTADLPGNREMELFGTNLAVIYGLGLIVAAFLAALIYRNFARAPAR